MGETITVLSEPNSWCVGNDNSYQFVLCRLAVGRPAGR